MVIPIDPSFERRTMALKDNEFKPGDLQWSERPARLQHKFLVLRKLGQGTYGKVQLALNKETNQEVAIKTIKKAKIESEEDMLRIRREIHIMTSIRHPHIIHINEVFETRQKIVIVMQYASGGELYDYLGCHHTLPEVEARRLFRQIASAIYYCHKNKICHRDLKLENILLDEKGNAQIADFGLSNIFDDRRRMNTFCGSPLYASPEIVKGTPYKGPEVDCWSLGVLLYTLIYGTMPFDGRNFKELVSQISEGRYEEPIIKSSASGLIRRLLTPEISWRATISDVCKDSWVNQGYDESLLIGAEKMTSEALLKTRKLGSPKFLSEKNNVKYGSKPSIFQAVTNIEKPKEENHSFLTNGDCEILSSVNNQTAQKASLYEQILNYDVSFVINKLLVAVESALKSPKAETNSQPSPTSANEMATQVLKPWPKNGEHTLPTKVDSEYVIPIFEVTSIVPKTSDKKSKNFNKEISNQCLQNSILNGFGPQNSELHIQNNKLNTKKKETVNPTETMSATSKANDSNAISNLQKDCSNPNTSNKNAEMTQSLDSNNLNKTNEQLLQVKKVNNQENILPRNPSVKMKRALENQLLGQKYFGSFFRSKNHSLTLARIFSMKYEKLVRTSFKLPDRKQKPPGKITIPPTFDPSISHNELLQERKEIVVFPTVSVSENKEKIEKKIDKIKKAALNMNHILRSNSANRLKIQKYLKSQAKKMQDLVCDEQRSINGSMEQINRCEGSVFSEAYFGKFEKGSLNAFNVKLHNKKINFVYSNGSGPENASIFDLMEREKMKFSGSGNLSEEDHSFGFFTLAKSKSDNQFPFQYTNCSTSTENYSEFNSFENKRFGYLLSVPGTDGNAKLLRSASDSEGLSYYRNVAKIEANQENYKASEMTFDVPQIKIHTSPLNTISKAYNEISGREAICLNELMPYLNLSGKESSIEKCKEYLMSLKHSDYKNSVHRSTASNASMNFQNINRNDKLYMQQYSTAYLLENGIHDDKTACGNTFSRDKIINKTKLFSELTNEDTECNTADIKQRSLRRRNTFSCEKDIMYTRMENVRGKSVDSYSDFDDCIRAFQSEQELKLAHQKDETKFSSSPNLCSFPMNKTSSLRLNDVKNTDIINKSGKFGNKNLLEDSQSSSFPSIAESSEKSAFLKRILQGSSFDKLSSRRINRVKSIGEDVLLYNGSSDLHAAQNERKLSMQQGITGNKEKTPFLSKFLNDLENREQHASTMNGDLSQRRYPRNAYVPGKRSKLEKRSKSFLQLLSLKRIQEAEKEIDRIERDSRMDAEEEESAGSLLEALKTHGYKGVISQRFQGAENSTMDTYNLYNTSPFLMRKLSPDISRFNSMYYDTSPQLSSPSYEIGDVDMLNGLTLKPSFDMYPDFRPNSSKQFVYDWLSTTNQNMECPTSIKTDQDSFLETDVYNPIKETENGLCFGKENSKPFEDEASSSESFETLKDHCVNGINENESFKTRDFSDYATLPHFTRSERNQLRRTSSTSEDEKEESVQDRIWRKSFYSRFNNSALSRKERSAFIDPHYSSESRASFSGSFSPSPFKVTHRDGTESTKLNGYKDMQSKRIHTPKKYSPTNDATFNDFVKMKPSVSSKDIADERTVNDTLETEFDETEPEH